MSQYRIFQLALPLSIFLSSDLTHAVQSCAPLFNSPVHLSDKQLSDNKFSGVELNPYLIEAVFSHSLKDIDDSILSLVSSQELAKALVYNLYLTMQFPERRRVEEFSNKELHVEPSEFVELQHIMSLSKFKEIKEIGFRNHFQLHPEIYPYGSSASKSYAGKRNLAEQRIIGAKFSEKRSDQDLLNKLRPTYAYVASPNLKSEWNVIRGVPNNQIVIIFNDNLQIRTTAVMGDSYDRFPNLSPGRPIYLGAPIGKKVSLTEAQIWGEISFHDIKELLVFPNISGEELLFVKSFGLPIYEGASILGPYGFQFIRGHKIQ